MKTIHSPLIAIALIGILQILAVPTHASGLLTAAPQFVSKSQQMKGLASPAEKWSETPIEVQFGLSGWVIAASNAPVEIIINNVTNVIHGIGTNDSTNMAPFYASVKADAMITVSVSGTNLGYVYLEFIKPKRTDYSTGRQRRGTTPKGYRTYVEAIEMSSVYGENTNGFSQFQNTWEIKLKAENKPGPLGTVEEIPDDVAPGDADWPQIGPGKSNQASDGGIKWEVNLGRLRNGKSAGKLRLAETSISAGTYSPLVLLYDPPVTNRDEVNLIETADGIAQIRTLQAFVDVVTNSYGFDLRFYTRDSLLSTTNQYGTNAFGNYSLQSNANPYVVWKVSNPDTNGATSRIRIEECRSNVIYTAEMGFDSTNSAWWLEYGTGADKRVEKRFVAFENVSTNAYRFETNVVTDFNGTNLFLCIECYQSLQWGWELVSSVVDPAGAGLTTLYTFHTNGSASEGLGQLSSIQYPDGYWERREYANGVLKRLLKPWMDSPADPSSATTNNSYYTEYEHEQLASGRVIVTLTTDWSGPDARIVRSTDVVPYESDTSYGELKVLDPENQFGAETGTWTYTRAAGELLDGCTLGLAHAWDAYTVFAYHAGTLGTNGFQVQSNGSDWRVCKLWSATFAYSTNETFDQIDGQSLWRAVTIFPATTTNVVQYYKSGCLTQTDVYCYFSVTNSILISRTIYLRDQLGRREAVIAVDPVTGLSNITYAAAWTNSNGIPLSTKAFSADESGITTSFSYDSQKRSVQQLVKRQLAEDALLDIADTLETIVYSANGLVLESVTASGSLTNKVKQKYDLAGRIVEKVDPSGVTSWVYTNGGRTISCTLPGGGTIVTNNYLDRRVASITGSAVTNLFYSYGTGDLESWVSSSRLFSTVSTGTTNSLRKSTTYEDMAGRPSGWSSLGYFVTNEVRTLIDYDYSYDTYRPLRTNTPGNGTYYSTPWHDGERRLIELSNHFADSTGRERKKWQGIVTNASGIYYATSNYLATSYVGSEPQWALMDVILTKIAGFSSGQTAETVTLDPSGVNATNRIYVNRSLATVEEVGSSNLSSNESRRITVGGLVYSERGFSHTNETYHQYDSFSREITRILPSGVTLYTAYDPARGLKVSETDIAGQTNWFSYFETNHPSANRLSYVTDARGKVTRFAYSPRGEQIHVWGDVPYPSRHVYSDFGELVELHTYRGGSNWVATEWPTNATGQGDVTKWVYQECSGLLLHKIDAKAVTNSFKYDAANRLVTNILARQEAAAPIIVGTTYNGYGEVVELVYPEGMASVVFSNYNKLGLPCAIIRGSVERLFEYDTAGRITMESEDGITNNYTYNQFGRTSLSVNVGTNTVTQTSAYDSATGRLLRMGANGVTATYSYLTNADLVSGVVFSNSTGAVLTTAKTFEYASRLKSITNTLAGGSNVSSHVYLYDAVHRRTNATLADGSYWRYGYDDRSQLTSAKRYWSGGGAVAGQQYEYSYDSIGNRTVTQSGGSQFGTSLRQTTWTVNELNQTITNAAYGYVNIFGEADASATVTVNHESVYRNGDFFRKELLFSNSSGPVYPSITNVAVINNYGTNGEDIVDQVIGNVWVPKNPETLLYDEDGNLIQDSRWVYRWDAENRLKEMETLSGLATNVPVEKLVFTYDHQGRRASKSVYALDVSSTNYLLSSLTKFVYDGWNLLVELDVPQGTNAPVLTKSFLWGLDLSSTPDQAGGIGGLLAVSQHATNGLSTHIPAFDGNGNVMALVNAGSGQPSARYEYAPFGEPLRVTGDAALLNPFRFSTKYTDDETGLLYYGYRYYSPSSGKWISRDPKGESGGNNLYAFIDNSPIDFWDSLGMSKGGKQNIQVGGFNTKSDVKDVEAALAEELRNSGGKYTKHAKKLKGLAKVINRGGAMSIIGGLGLSIFATSVSADEAYENVRSGRRSQAGTSEAFTESAFINLEIGDQAMADLDMAIAAAMMAGEGGMNAMIIWGELMNKAGELGY